MSPALAQFDTWQLVALAAALGWASGVRLYAVLFIVGGLGYLGWIPLPGGLSLLAHPYVLAASSAMFAVEFVADKVPVFDSFWDTLQTFVRGQSIRAPPRSCSGGVMTQSGTEPIPPSPSAGASSIRTPRPRSASAMRRVSRDRSGARSRDRSLASAARTR